LKQLRYYRKYYSQDGSALGLEKGKFHCSAICFEKCQSARVLVREFAFRCPSKPSAAPTRRGLTMLLRAWAPEEKQQLTAFFFGTESRAR
jgi:hypothetical protein